MITEKIPKDVRHVTAGSLSLTYRLEEEELDGRASFSISVSLYDSASERRDSAEVRDVTSEKNEAIRIFGLVSEGVVTPMTLTDVISDLIG